MEKVRSIQSKLISNIMLLLSLFFLFLLIATIAINIYSFQKNIEKSTVTIQNIFVNKGKLLLTDVSLAIKELVANNSLSATNDLLSSTITNDTDIVYAIYWTAANQSLIYISTSDSSKKIDSLFVLKDSLSYWATHLKTSAYKLFTYKSIRMIEFATPIIVNNKTFGYLRYGYDPRAMDKLLSESTINARNSLERLITLMLITGLISLGIVFFIIRRLATHITRPINSLVKSTRLITQGNYNVAIRPESNDEIGNLASDFESMRETIKKYTDHLQDIIDEQMQQVNDILNNIDHGLFTINLDGTVNQEYSLRANQILNIKDIASCSLQEILRLDEKQQYAFNLWLNLVKTKHKKIRWPKLVRLAPVSELELHDPEKQEITYVSISYQCIYDKDNKLAKIMVLAMDETEKRTKDLQMAIEKQKYDNDVKSLLSIANSTPDEIAEFVEDTESRMVELKKHVALHLEEVIRQRQEYPNGKEHIIYNEVIDILYRDLHTIKGNSGSYSFELLAMLAHQAEDTLEKLRQPLTVRRQDELCTLKNILAKMDVAVNEIHQKVHLIFGQDEEFTIRVPEYRIKEILDVCNSLPLEYQFPPVQNLVNQCIMLSWKPLKVLLRKYKIMTQKIAYKLHKEIDFVIINEQQFFNPSVLNSMDEILIHIVRNAADHGIESQEIREELGKNIGKITMEVSIIDNTRKIVITDDGKGIDVDKLVSSAIEKKIITEIQANQLTNMEKIHLLFINGITTSSYANEFSGRGIGMDIVKQRLTQIHGTIMVESTLGKGTTFTILAPLPEESPFLKLS